MERKPRCGVFGEYGQCTQDATYHIMIKTDKSIWQRDVCEDHRDEERESLRGFAESVHRQTVLSETCVPLYGGIACEQARIKALFTEDSRPIAWKEVSTLVRYVWWEVDIARERGIAVLYSEMQRIASVSRLRTMTPAQFWQMLRQMDPARVAEVERKLS